MHVLMELKLSCMKNVLSGAHFQNLISGTCTVSFK